MKISFVTPLLIATLWNDGLVDAFQPLTPEPRRINNVQLLSLKSQETEVSPLSSATAAATSNTDISNSPNQGNDEFSQASKWKAEAERIRSEAAQLDSALTSQKIEILERKLSNKSWRERNPEQAENMEQQLDDLKRKLSGREPLAAASAPVSSTSAIMKDNKSSSIKVDSTTEDNLNSKARDKKEISTGKAKKKESSNKYGENPLCGFDQEDLDLYIPVVESLEEQLPSNATLQEKLVAFRQAPELQEHFEEKIRKIIVEPMEEMARLVKLKQEYLESSSSVERKQLKREIEKLENAVDDDGPIMYSDTIFLNDLPYLSEEEVQARIEAVESLHPVLQAIYKQRCGAGEEGDLRTAIELDHFEPQLQLLEQVRSIEPVTDDMKHEIRLAILSMPMSARNKLAEKLGIENGEDVTEIIDELANGEGEGEWMTLQQVMGTSNNDGNDDSILGTLDLPEYNDLDFMDRSRYVKEFIPSIVRLEMVHPSPDEIDTFMKDVLDRKAFTVTSAPERVIGGYYIRGLNMMSDGENGNNDEMVQYLQEKLQKSSLKDKIDFFYIQDPSPPTDEEYEMGEIDRPVLLVTAKNRLEMYNPADPAMKTAVSLLALVGVFVFGLATSQLQPFLNDQVEAAAAGDLSVDITPIFDSAYQVALSMVAIQAAHELGHRVVAWKDKFDIGFPTIIPSVQLGLLGTITPFKSPPPSSKSMFDFAMAGPLAGLALSFALLIGGLDMTASADLRVANLLPAFPVNFLRASALGGGMVEYFLGKGALMKSTVDAVLPLHPLAIAGFAGMISNALALLPLGNTDGGRISQVMFGRRGSYLVSIFTTLLLCALGLFGFDEPRIFLTYILFAMIWQRELESPALNEADELDFGRGLVGIGSAIVVFLTLLPML